MVEPEQLADGIWLYEGDCLEVLPTLEPGSVDAVVTDPPYGMNWNTDSKRFSGGQQSRGEGRNDWGEVTGDHEEFDPIPWLNFPVVVLWGQHHYANKLPVGTTLVWVKKDKHLWGTFLSDADTAWMKGGHGVYLYHHNFPPPVRAMDYGGDPCRPTGIHPTQKPVGLMRWCIQKAKVPKGGTILDPYAGSGTTGVAAMLEGSKCIMVEKDPRYCQVIRERIRRADGREPGTLTAMHAAGLFEEATA